MTRVNALSRLGYFCIMYQLWPLQLFAPHECSPSIKFDVYLSSLRSNQHLKKQGRCEVFKREPPEGEEDTWEPTEEEQVSVGG